MKKLTLLLFTILLVSPAFSQKFVYGDQHVYGNSYVTKSIYAQDSISAPYIRLDSLVVSDIKDSLSVPYLKADSLQATSINDSLSVPYLKTDSVLLTAQNVKYVSGFSLPTGSLTDGTPTEAEITAIVGSPANKGTGYRAIILDSDGSGLLYLIVSDGTGWNYIALTLAL